MQVIRTAESPPRLMQTGGGGGRRQGGAQAVEQRIARGQLLLHLQGAMRT